MIMIVICCEVALGVARLNCWAEISCPTLIAGHRHPVSPSFLHFITMNIHADTATQAQLPTDPHGRRTTLAHPLLEGTLTGHKKTSVGDQVLSL